MRTVLIIALVVLGIILVGSILLMNPKGGGIGLGIGGAAGSAGGNEYGSKKSIEGTLKQVATITAILFVGICLFLPFVN
ncbi:MAG: preprotein translocase subunit SecG [Candidatus Absconditabacteria bacterium]|nr:preprotein translocase subunit SecG [Candidatus Absconditabacteria bacterium]MDD3868055.1 preprotein translocase subunit SecG [Candidatus Absconditabacteria bacterium]MDD4714302.1 preprotein translocase subunit SecG [Candidatus Absconditabacteria bacterium]